MLEKNYIRDIRKYPYKISVDKDIDKLRNCILKCNENTIEFLLVEYEPNFNWKMIIDYSIIKKLMDRQEESKLYIIEKILKIDLIELFILNFKKSSLKERLQKRYGDNKILREKIQKENIMLRDKIKEKLMERYEKSLMPLCETFTINNLYDD